MMASGGSMFTLRALRKQDQHLSTTEKYIHETYLARVNFYRPKSPVTPVSA